MNRDKRAVAQVLGDLCGAYVKDRTVPHRVAIVIHNSVARLAESEERSIRKMEPFKENEGTAANYRRAVDCYEALQTAAAHIAEGEMLQASTALYKVAGLAEQDPVPEPTRAKARRRRG